MSQKTTDDALTIQSQTIDWLRFPFMLFVVFIHATPNSFVISEINFSRFTGNDFNTLIYGISRNLAGICNSGFFIFSGYWFFYNVKEFDKNVYMAKMKSRLHTLVIPYFLWLSIAVLANVLRKTLGAILKGSAQNQTLSEWFAKLMEKGILRVFWDFNTWGETNKNILGQFTPNSGPFVIPLWFLQNLIVLSLLSPLIYLIVKKLKLFSIIALCMLYLTGLWFVVPSPKISALFFFAVGAYFGINKQNMVFELRRYKHIFYSIAFVSLLCGLCISIFFNGKIGYTGYLHGIRNISWTFSSIVFASYLIENKKVTVLPILSKSMFFVYSLHTIMVMTAVKYIFTFITRHSDFWLVNTLRYPIVTVVTTFLCIFAYWFLCKFKYLRPIAKVLSGNR